jgi:hypothetical protein
MFFMGLDVLSKLDPTVFVVVDAKTSDDVARAESFGYAVLVGKSIQPEDAEENHFDQHSRRILVKWSGGVVATGSFLSGPDTSLDVGDVFVLTADVEFTAEVGGDGATGAFKFGVTKDHGDAEAAFTVDAVYALKRALETGLFSVVKGLGGYEMNLLRNGHEERDSIHEHEVNTESHVAIAVKDLGG